MELKKVKSIIIVGGGSSGWMAAAYLSNVLVDVAITVIESPAIATIGVGEATFPFIRAFLERIGLGDDRQWMSKCDATFKAGILYRDWFREGEEYWHPLLEQLDYLDRNVHSGHCWLTLRHAGRPAFQTKWSFYESAFVTTGVNVVNRRIPAAHDYAYHINVERFVRILRTACCGVTHVPDTVKRVRLDDQGAIAALVTEEHGELAADLYVDCSGFRRVLIREVAPGQAFISYSRSLFCDSAVVLHLPYEEQERRQLPPFITCAARSAGWMWTIPLYSQISSGYVYSASFVSPDDAEAELRRQWGERRTNGLESIRVKFVTGKLERLWVKNCVAVGLSSGFVEPLESPGLAITQVGVEMLASMLDARYYDERMIERYNAYLEKFYTDIVQFLIAHYIFTARDDSAFWRAVREDTLVPDDLRLRLEMFRKHLPTVSTKGLSEVWMFRDLSWFSVLLGMNFDFEVPTVSRAILAAYEVLMDDKRKSTEDLLRQLPGHYEYLRREVYSEEEAGNLSPGGTGSDPGTVKRGR